jgi:hypothetical protein
MRSLYARGKKKDRRLASDTPVEALVSRRSLTEAGGAVNPFIFKELINHV